MHFGMATWFFVSTCSREQVYTYYNYDTFDLFYSLAATIQTRHCPTCVAIGLSFSPDLCYNRGQQLNGFLNVLPTYDWISKRLRHTNKLLIQSRCFIDSTNVCSGI